MEQKLIKSEEGKALLVRTAKKNLYALMKEILNNHIEPDVRVRIGGITFNCHLMVLQCYSDFFKKHNTEVLINLPVQQITAKGFSSVYYWMLAEEPKIKRKDIIEIFIAANYLGIKELVEQCWLYFDNDEGSLEDNAFFLYLEARMYRLDELELLILTRVSKFFLSLVASKEFLNFSTEQIIMLLTSNNIGINSEMEIFMAAVRWLTYNWDERKKDMVNVIKCVRFSLMPRCFLIALSNKIDCLLVGRIASNRDVMEMIHEGLCFTTLQFYYGNNRKNFLNMIESYKMIEPIRRQWIYDKGCSYHHHVQCPNIKFIKYGQFLQYLKQIQHIGPAYWKTLEMAKIVESSKECCKPE